MKRTIKCKICGKTITAKAGNMKYCPECAKLTIRKFYKYTCPKCKKVQYLAYNQEIKCRHCNVIQKVTKTTLKELKEIYEHTNSIKQEFKRIYNQLHDNKITDVSSISIRQATQYILDYKYLVEPKQTLLQKFTNLLTNNNLFVRMFK